MSDTPETDHLEDQLGSAAKFSHPVIWKHARQLERGRDEAKADAARIADILSGLELRTTEELAKLERERNEARAVADELASVAAHCLGWHDHESPDAAIKIAAALKRWKKMRREL